MATLRRIAATVYGSGHSWCLRRHVYTRRALHTGSLRCLASQEPPGDTHEDEEPDSENELLNDDEMKRVLKGTGGDYISPHLGHRVFVLQPDMKRINKTTKSLTTTQHQLEEACALVECLPNWKVVGSVIKVLHSRTTGTLFNKGSFGDMREMIRKHKGVSAVFFSVTTLSVVQLRTLQQAWRVPVYDRFTIVLQIFKLRAQTKEAKLQVALAEIPYYRSRMIGVSQGMLHAQADDTSVFTGSGGTFLETRRRVLGVRERKLKKALEKIKSNRELLRAGRDRMGWPVVAVVGYTNAGKTSLIKALTEDQRMEPKDQLFATLDVTTHAGRLANGMKVLYVDTVGFIADIPTGLIASFAATLEDVMHADLIVHVRDISHPDRENQKANVLRTLSRLHLPSRLKDNIIEVANKVDKLSDEEMSGMTELMPEDSVLTSTTTGLGLHVLTQHLSDSVMTSTDRLSKCFRVPMAGQHLSWLYKEATIQDTRPCDRSPEFLLVDVIITQAAYAKFLHNFGKPKRTTPGQTPPTIS